MATYAEHAKRFAHLRALYDQGDAQNDFSECIEQCERSIELVQASYWRIKTLCLLARCHQHDWKKALEWRRSGEDLYWRFPQDGSETMEELRVELDDLYDLYDLSTCRVKDVNLWFPVEDRVNRSGTGDEASASGEVVETEVDKFDEATKRSGAVEGAEEAAAVHGGESSEVDEMRKQTRPVGGAGSDGGAKKKSFRSWMARIVRRTQDRLAKRDLDKTLTSRLDFDKRLGDAIQQMREAALEDFKRLRQDFNDKAQRMQEDFDDKVQQMKDAADSHTIHLVEKAAKEIETVALRIQQTANTEHGRRMEEAVESHREQMKEAKEGGYRHRLNQQADGFLAKMAGFENRCSQ